MFVVYVCQLVKKYKGVNIAKTLYLPWIMLGFQLYCTVFYGFCDAVPPLRFFNKSLRPNHSSCICLEIKQ